MLKIYNSITKLHLYILLLASFHIVFIFYFEANPREVWKRKHNLCWDLVLLWSVLHCSQLSHKMYIFRFIFETKNILLCTRLNLMKTVIAYVVPRPGR